MKRCVAELTEGYVNIHADRLELDREGNMIYAWNSADLVGAFDIHGGKTMIPFPNKKYSVIYADPPWSYHDKRCNYNSESKEEDKP